MAAKSAPFSLRLSKETDRLVTAEARRTKRSKGSVVEMLAEEALKARLVPGIAFRGDDYNRRAWLIGTSLDVWQVIEAYEDFDRDGKRMVAETDLTERELRTALSYYERFPQEVDHSIGLNRRPLAELRADFPHADVISVELD
jgi:precorrin-6B methylase 2